MKSHSLAHRLGLPFTAISLSFAFLLLLAPPALAVPMFSWSGPWSVTFDPEICAPPGACILGGAAFGASANTGQITDTTADRALARSFNSTSAGSSFTAVGVVFSRDFILSGSPAGWNLQLDGMLNGAISAFGGAAASAEVHVNASVLQVSGLAVALDQTVHGSAASPFGETQTFNVDLIDAAHLTDGLYTVSGFLRSNAGFFGEPDIAFASFFGPGDGWSVGVLATPVPEPTSWLLLGSGVVFMLQRGWRLRKNGRQLIELE